LELCRKSGRTPIAICSMPTEGFYAPIVYVPHPFQNIEILSWLWRAGVRKLDCKGSNLSIFPLVQLNVNIESFATFQASPETPADVLITEIARSFVGADHADMLVKAWRLTDIAQRQRPLWNHSFATSLSLMPGPLVPNPGGLSKAELAYYDHQAYGDLEKIPGQHRLRVLQMDEKRRSWSLEKYKNETIPLLDQAFNSLRQEVAKCRDEQYAMYLTEQADHIYHFMLWQQCAYNWCEAGIYLVPGSGTGQPLRSMSQIIEDEIDVSRKMLDLLRGRERCFIFLSDFRGAFYSKSPQFVEQISQRIDVMRSHRNDSVVPIRRFLSSGLQNQ